MLSHANAVAARVRAVSALSSKTFMLVAPRDSAGNLPTAPYAVVQPADGMDESDRLVGPRLMQNPRCVVHVVGATFEAAQGLTELVKAQFLPTNGVPVQVNVSGERGRGLDFSSQPVNVDSDVTPPIIFTTSENSWISEPA